MDWYVTKGTEVLGWIGGGRPDFCLHGPCDTCDMEFSQPASGDGLFVEDQCPDCYWHEMFEEIENVP